MKIGEVGKILKFFLSEGGTPIDLSGMTLTLQVQGQADRTLTITTAATGECHWDLVAGDFTTSNFTKPGAYTSRIKMVSGANTYISDPFTITVKGDYEA